MNGFYFFLALISFVFAILSIILFFKMWGMTNDVAEIKELLKKQNEYKNEEKSIEKIITTVDDVVPENNIPEVDNKSEKVNGSINTGLIPLFLGAIILTILVLVLAFGLAQ